MLFVRTDGHFVTEDETSRLLQKWDRLMPNNAIHWNGGIQISDSFTFYLPFFLIKVLLPWRNRNSAALKGKLFVSVCGTQLYYIAYSKSARALRGGFSDLQLLVTSNVEMRKSNIVRRLLLDLTIIDIRHNTNSNHGHESKTVHESALSAMPTKSPELSSKRSILRRILLFANRQVC